MEAGGGGREKGGRQCSDNPWDGTQWSKQVRRVFSLFESLTGFSWASAVP